MTEKRYTITIGQNNEFKEIIDHCRQDKQISVFEFLKQVGEQDKAFKKLKKENKELKQENEYIKNTIQSMLELERTEMGKNTLKQLMEVIQNVEENK